ncbi:MAG TPA: hypothetical protein VH186_34670 [Chloroflexia bacterium]|nr:hypothetical protein [Chloroflexia bacterium]
MFKPVKKVLLITLLSLMAVLALAACGDSTATPATSAGGSSNTTAAAQSNGGSQSSGGNFYVVSGASATDVPAALKTGLATYESQYPGSKAQAYKISESPAKVKELLANAFTKEGWQNLTANVPDTGGNFALGFTKNNKGAAAIGFPGVAAGLSQSDTLYIVFLPQ